ncbi:hypothetical protein HDU98_009510 [Podochytrium sp. JEL0797]|nr:hypothetical protein HDU98_009510 [Podochytrium sp. JEL0797]
MDSESLLWKLHNLSPKPSKYAIRLGSSLTGIEPVFAPNTLKPNTRVAEDGLTKRTITLLGSDRKRYRIISYYTPQDVVEMTSRRFGLRVNQQRGLEEDGLSVEVFQRPSEDPELAALANDETVDYVSLLNESVKSKPRNAPRELDGPVEISAINRLGPQSTVKRRSKKLKLEHSRDGLSPLKGNGRDPNVASLPPELPFQAQSQQQVLPPLIQFTADSTTYYPHFHSYHPNPHFVPIPTFPSPFSSNRPPPFPPQNHMPPSSMSEYYDPQYAYENYESFHG